MISRLVMTGILSCILASPLFAADGTLNIKGRIIQNSCALESSINNVSLGEIDIAELKGSTTHLLPFTLQLMNCPQSEVIVSLEGSKVQSQPGLCMFGLDNQGTPDTATGIGLMVMDFDNANYFSTCTSSHRMKIKDNSIKLHAAYEYARDPINGDPLIKPGKANVTVQISITQL